MKFRLQKRELRGENDIWRGKYRNYYAIIETPFRDNHPDFGVYSFRIRTPERTFVDSNALFLKFELFDVCKEYVIKWIENKTNKV